MSKGGKKFGLILPGKSQLSAPKSSNIFGDDGDSDENSGPSWMKKTLKAEETKTRVKKQTRLDIEKAMTDDPTIFQYDELYDDMEREKNVTKAAKKEDKKPKYVLQLLKAAERRKQEHEHRVERMVQKEREAEGEKYADKESFVTSAYREKLEEFKKMEAEQERMEKIEAMCDVTKQQDMSGFYRQMYAQKFNDTADENSKKTEAEEETLAESSRTDELDKDTSSGGSSSSSEEEDEEKVKSNFPSRKSRQYRKRAVEEESESDNEENADDDKETRQKTPPPPPPSKKKTVEPESKRKSPSPDGKINPQPTLASKNEEKQKKKKEEIVEKKKEPEEIIKVSIWEKRTVGKVFDDALQRYLARKALRTSG